ncbi:MAG TPA: ASKHA domain-containing protein [Nocardioidaceae bacterium]|nr:ASKHA domain-containing protein [Nocardioidaceae bacterium]
MPVSAAGTVDVSFAPAGRRGAFPSGTTVLEAARSLGVDLDSVCGGRGICGRCQVTLGSRPGVGADADRLSSPSATEAGYAGRRPVPTGHRLGCAARILDDVVIDVPESSQVHRQVVRKDAGSLDVPVDPVLALRYVEVAAPTLQDATGDLQRLRVALHDEWQLSDLRVDHAVLRALQPALERGGRRVTVAVRSGRDVVAVWPGLHDRAHGVAFDVGSTTLAGHLCDLFTGEVLASAGRMNPQIGFGEDLMSRVSYVMMNPGGEQRLTSVVREALAAMVAELCAEADVDPLDVLEVTVVGNPIMHHLVLGLDPRPLGSAPFALATTEAVTVPAAELGLGVHPGARVYSPPCIAGHVGADAAAMVLAEAPHHQDALTLLVDVGTNAEIVLGSSKRLLAASSPTGPAFEGAQISSGQRAAPGAVERVRIDRETLEPRLRVIGSRIWSDDPRFARAVRRTGVTGICGSGIIEVVAELFLAGVISADGTIRESASHRVVPQGRTFSYRLWDDPVIEVTQADVRAIQLAKAALQAGCRLLMDHLGVDTVDEVRLTGAFGNHIDPVYATVLGLVPDCDLDRVRSVGNAAGRGSLMLLLSGRSRADVEAATARIEKIETALEPAFQAHFVDAMGFPHSTLPYPHLAERVSLPAPATPEPRHRRTGRRSRSG